jgi:hypothetical protein
MRLNGRQIIKVLIGIGFTLFILFAYPAGVSATNKIIIIAIMWLATLAGIWIRRDRQ